MCSKPQESYNSLGLNAEQLELEQPGVHHLGSCNILVPKKASFFAVQHILFSYQLLHCLFSHDLVLFIYWLVPIVCVAHHLHLEEVLKSTNSF